RSYLLNIAWSVEKPQETLVYRMDIETVMPRGLEPAADLIKTRTSAPGGLPGGLSGGARPKLKDLQR
ncbi:MAG: hypothetical protein LDL19_04135, partial [Thiobacillus sp.]|nr:hypothetical protein [Thiobacillus sp.]